MVDRVSDKSLQDLNLLGTQQQSQVEKVTQSNQGKSKTDSATSSFDTATISDDAINAWEQEKDVLKFSRLAQRGTAPVDYDKVNQIKNLLDSGRINQYLSTVDTNALVENLLNSPASTLLQ